MVGAWPKGAKGRGRRANAGSGERVLAHLGAPDLGAHEGGEGEADDHAADDPAGGILHEHNAEDGRGGDPQQERDPTARAQHVANNTASGTRIQVSLARICEEGGELARRGACCTPGAEARDNVGGDCEDVARADLALRQVEGGLLLHVHHQWCSCGVGRRDRWLGYG